MCIHGRRKGYKSDAAENKKKYEKGTSYFRLSTFKHSICTSFDEATCVIGTINREKRIVYVYNLRNDCARYYREIFSDAIRFLLRSRRVQDGTPATFPREFSLLGERAGSRLMESTEADSHPKREEDPFPRINITSHYSGLPPPFVPFLFFAL